MKHAIFLPILIGIILAATPANAQRSDTFTTPVALTQLDPAVYTASIGSQDASKELPKDGPRHVIWTSTSAPEWDGVTFGESKTPGVRHLRVGFTSEIEVGTIITRGSIQVSVLTPVATYPGDLNNENVWKSAYRILGAAISRSEPGVEDYALWVLPPHTRTRAIRFSHMAITTDTHYAGWLGGAYVLKERYTNAAVEAKASASANTENAGLVNDGSNNGTWGAWDNGDQPAHKVTPDSPEWIRLIWPHAVTLTGLDAIWAGFAACDIQAFDAHSSRKPTEAQEQDWKTIGSFASITNQYPRSLSANWLAFASPVSTRAIRVRITAPTEEAHPHLVGKTQSGRRVWLGELVTLRPLGDAPLESALPPAPAIPHPPIAIHFSLPRPAHVTLVIEDRKGKRIRNLIADTTFPAGDNTAWWDGTDDLGRDTGAARHGIYHVPGEVVAPGDYTVRGLYHTGLDLRYEFSIYNAGHPAWETADHTGGWLANHTPPSAALFVPAGPDIDKPTVLIGSYVTEGGAGLAWLDLDGKKRDGKGWLGGAWTGAPYLTRDAGPHPIPGTYAYVGAAWGDLRLTAIGRDGDHPVLSQPYHFPGMPQDDHNPNSAITGLAAYNGILIAALPKLNELLFANATHHAILGSADLSDPRGIAFDSQGRLLAISGSRLLRYQFESPLAKVEKITLPEPQVLVAEGLDDPQGITLDSSGNIYISENDARHQVRVFSPEGKLLRSIGHAGKPAAGPYDPLHMNHPAGLTIDSLNRLWVTENDFQPKRVSVWTLDGKLIRAFYGPSEYGGGGSLDPLDRSRFYFHGMEFHLDWATGKDILTNVFYRADSDRMPYPDGFGTGAPPETPIYMAGRQFMTNCYNSNPTQGAPIGMIWRMVKGIAVPAAALGRAQDWNLLKSAPFLSRWPVGINPKGDYWQNQAAFLWIDKNGDGLCQPDEVTLWKGVIGGVTVMPDMALLASHLDDKAVRLPLASIDKNGIPTYALASMQTLATGANGAVSSGGDQAITGTNGWTVLTNAPAPFSPYSLGGVKNGVPMWSYPSLWPGLHASHEAPSPEFAGELIGTTRLLGPILTPAAGEAGPIYCINGNMGCMYLMTQDGLFIAQLLEDVRQGRTWTMPASDRNMRVNGLTMHDENFWPSIARTSDGKIYLNASHPSLVRIDGLETVTRLTPQPLHISSEMLQQAHLFAIEAERKRQSEDGSSTITIRAAASIPKIEESAWSDAAWMTIDKRGVAANFDSNSKPYNVRAAVSIYGDRLFATYLTGDPELLANSGETPNALFKTGGALDLMLGSVEGGMRLIVTQVKGAAKATLYQAHLPGSTARVAFSSPSRTITIDSVRDVSSDITLQSDGKGSYLISAPLSLLNIRSEKYSFKADIGVLRGNGFQTLQRVYWNNKATGIVADVPSEVELVPELWGTWTIEP